MTSSSLSSSTNNESKKYFETTDTDPRDCLYRFVSGKHRKQIEQTIRIAKLRYDVKARSSPSHKKKEDEKETEMEEKQKPQQQSTVKNRFVKSSSSVAEEEKEKIPNINDNDEDILQLLLNKNKKEDKQDKIGKLLKDLDSILIDGDQHKDTFTYDNIVNLYRLLQHLDLQQESNSNGKQQQYSKAASTATPTTETLPQFFYQFMESYFRVLEPPKRENASLDERLRKLRCEEANREYNLWTTNVSHLINRGRNKPGAGGAVGGGSQSTKISFNDDWRAIRSTLLATINAFMVIVATFAFFYIVIGYVRPQLEIAYRVLYSFFASLVVAVAEVYFLLRVI